MDLPALASDSGVFEDSIRLLNAHLGALLRLQITARIAPSPSNLRMKLYPQITQIYADENR
jgi:hypothetical protein